jgi:hypothetical protein
MPSEDTIARLRRMTGEYPSDDSTFTDTELIIILESVDNDLNLAASRVWGDKASEVADEVNTSEAGSSRSNSDLFAHAKDRQEYYSQLASTGTDVISVASSTTRRIERV